MMKKTILFNLLMLLLLTSCGDNNDELEKDNELITIEKVIGSTYYCEEQNSIIEFVSYSSLENSNWGKEVVYFVDCNMHGDIVLKETGKDIVELSLKVDNNVISDRIQGQYKTNISFTIVDENLLIGRDKVEGNWIRK